MPECTYLFATAFQTYYCIYGWKLLSDVRLETEIGQLPKSVFDRRTWTNWKISVNMVGKMLINVGFVVLVLEKLKWEIAFISGTFQAKSDDKQNNQTSISGYNIKKYIFV